MEEKLQSFEFSREFYDSLKLISPMSVGKIVLALSKELFNDTEEKTYDLTAEEEAILILIKSLYDVSDRLQSVFN